ncbi:putative lipoprotein [Pasteurella langaaensis DSM 22999]|uniref:Putative lipoprotein n=1 Tax=Alitibacter langaaensis DSM 22999 TaxID=1122935 RepID=A0A2U0TGI1_9PAST|nr:YajG family lipoprotein [Pasteurella langaaensis]PVX42710.1 putative lipoprotein [Pasteurella langaaensis DSM 22999]
MKLKKFSFAALLASSMVLAACSSTSNTLTFNPQAPTAATVFNTNNQKAIVSVVTKDDRGQPEISNYVRDGQIQKLYASPDVSQLFQQVMQQNLNAKGFRLATNGANTNVLISVKNFFAKVDQGNLRYEINSKIQLTVHVQGAKGNFTKNLGATRTQKGAFNANNDEIKNVLDANLKEVITAIYQDQEITNAINQYSN